MRNTLRILVGGAIAAAAAIGSANALVIDSSTYTAAGCLGSASCVIDNATLTAGPAQATFSEQNYRGVAGLGVDYLSGVPAGSNNANELQGGLTGGTGETITVDYDVATLIDEIVLAHFYNPEEFDADPQEVAIITATNEAGQSATMTIRNNDNTAAGFDVTYSGDVVVTAMVDRISTFTGEFSITDFFPELGKIVKLVFEAGQVDSGDNADYSIALIREVPIPGAAFLLLSGIAGLGFAGRRKAA